MRAEHKLHPLLGLVVRTCAARDSNAHRRSTVRCARVMGWACDGVRACLSTECNFSDAQERRKSQR